jgi:hypothetical protein
MDSKLISKFIDSWTKHFGNAELPFTFSYSDRLNGVKLVKPKKKWNCLISELEKVRKGESLAFNKESLGCMGAKRYLGYTKEVSDDFKYFLSCGFPGRTEGERYLQTPALVEEWQKQHVPIEGVRNKYIVFKRWDELTESDHADVVVFYATPDVLSGLYTLANYDQAEPNGTFTPFGSGCAAIIHYPYLESFLERPRAVIGMFDPSARPYVPENSLSFAVPMIKFEKMIVYMAESFLITDTWETIKRRITNN